MLSFGKRQFGCALFLCGGFVLCTSVAKWNSLGWLMREVILAL